MGNELEMMVKAAVERCKEEAASASNKNRDYGSSGSAITIAGARLSLAQAHLEQALKVLTDNK
jgi:hypothetical protein